MKYLKKKKKSHGGMIAVIVILAALILGMVAWMMNPFKGGREEAAAATTVPVQTEAVESVTIPVETLPEIRPANVVQLLNGEIETPYGFLRYPEELADHLIIAEASEDPYTLVFYAAMEGKQEIRLFNIALGEGSGGNMGIVTTEQGEIPLNIVLYSLSFDDTWTEGETITAQAMQDVVNDMIEQMAPQAQNTQTSVPAVNPQPVATDTVNNIEIMTPYCSLYYPARWSNTLRYVHDDTQEDVYKVIFYGKMDSQDEQLLFSIYFGGDEGEQLGAVKGADGVPVPVNLLMVELDITDLVEEEAERMQSMQEAVNQLIEKIPFME